MQTTEVFEKYPGDQRAVNLEASHCFRPRMRDDELRVRTRLVRGSHLITRNTTESLDTVVSGFDWKVGDEMVMVLQDYGAMRDHFAQMVCRHGIIAHEVSVPLEPASDDELVTLYADAITPQLRDRQRECAGGARHPAPTHRQSRA